MNEVNEENLCLPKNKQLMCPAQLVGTHARVRSVSQTTPTRLRALSTVFSPRSLARIHHGSIVTWSLSM